MTDDRQAAHAALNGQQSDEELSVTKRQSRCSGDRYFRHRRSPLLGQEDPGHAIYAKWRINYTLN